MENLGSYKGKLMSKWYELHIKSEILFWFFMVALFPILTLYSLNYYFEKNQFETQAIKQIDLILDEKIRKIETQIQNVENDIKLISNTPTIIESFLECEKGFRANNNQAIQNPKLDKLLKNFTPKNDFYDLFFISNDGFVIYTLKKESDLNTNLVNGIYKETNLAKVYQNAKLFLEVKISEFEYYQPSNNFGAFIAHPLFEEDKMIGVLATQIKQNKIFDMESIQEGLGETGELFAVTKHKTGKVVSVTPLKYQKDSIQNEFIIPDVPGIPVKKAIKGERGSGIAHDYRGVEIIASWGYIPELNWGVVVKIDKSEVFKPLLDMQYYSFFIIFIVILLIVVAIFMATKHIVSPIEALSERVKNFSIDTKKDTFQNDLDLNNEIGVLSKNFNELASNLLHSQKTIQKYASELEGKVKERTNQLEIAKEKLEETNSSMKLYLDIVDKYVITSSTDLEGIITEVSSAFCKITGYSKEELIGKKHNILSHPSVAKELYQEMWHTITHNQTWSAEMKNLAKNGTFYWVHATITPTYDKYGKKVGYTSITENITDKKKMEKISITDGLTGVYNRRYFNEVFPKIIETAKRKNELISFLMLDIDHFKQYNDSYGHQMGDTVLIKFAKALKDSVHRGDDYAFRLGGEEFGVIYKSQTPQKALEFANLIKDNIKKLNISHEYSQCAKCITASMGLVCKPALDMENVESIYKEADNLLYKSKKSGRDKISCSFSPC